MRMIIVSAVEHPDLDNWVFDEARAEATRSDLLLGEYLGREDVLPQAPPGLCCHVFAAELLGTPEASG
jgi:hypothetical protein